MARGLYISRKTFERLQGFLGDFLGAKYEFLENRDCFHLPDCRNWGTSEHQCLYNTSGGTFKVPPGTIKPSRLFKELCPSLTPPEIGKLAHQWQALYSDTWRLIKLSDKPSEIYDLPHATKGTIGSSCMKEKGDLYRDFDDIVQVAYLTLPSGILIGRALVWKAWLRLDGEWVPITFMDRVYYSKERILHAFLRFAKEQGWAHKAEQSNNPEVPIVLPDDTVIHHPILITFLPFVDDQNFPYLDTFRFVSEESVFYSPDKRQIGHLLSNIMEPPEYVCRCWMEASRTDGYLESPYSYVCDGCGYGIPEDEVYYIHDSVYCPACVDELFYYIEQLEDYFYKDDCSICAHCGCPAPNDTYYRYCIAAEDTSGNPICSECLERYYTICDRCEYAVHYSEVREAKLPNGEELLLCPHCYEDIQDQPPETK